MNIEYSSIVDWHVDEKPVSEVQALSLLSEESQELIKNTFERFAEQKISFGISDGNVGDSEIYLADFTPSKNHPEAKNYDFFTVPGKTPEEAIKNAQIKLVLSMNKTQ